MGVRNAIGVVVVIASACKPAAPAQTSPAVKHEASAARPSGSASPLPVTPAPQAGGASNVPLTKVTLAEAGLEAASLDRSVDPCVDFFQFACGGWLTANQIPADRARWGRFTEIDEKIKVAIRALLEEDAKGLSGDPAAKKLGDYYASCMDEAALEKAGTAAIKPLLDRTMKLADAKAWASTLTELHKLGIWVVFDAAAAADLKMSTTYSVYLDTAGLGLPDRDYYLKPEYKKDVLDGYKQHVGRMLALASVPKPEAAAADVVAIETELAKLTKTATERRDVQASYNPLEIKKLPKSIDWKAYFKVFGASPGAKVIVTTPKFFAGLDGLRKSLKLPQWASYFTYHLLVERAFALPKAFDDEAFKLQQLVTGVTEKQARFKRCIDATTAGLGELLGRQYVEKYFPPQARQTATMLVDGLVKVMNEELGGLDWMTPASRQAAQAKLGKVVRMIGYPDKWRVYDFEVKRDDFGGNELRASAFEVHRVIARAGKPVDRGEWLMNAFAVNAYYNPRANNSALPAGILQPPFFGSERSVAANLGGIGMAIGHELTHGFDDQGAQFDGNGNLASWWAKGDQQKFEERGKCVATMYSSFEAMPKMYVNGELTLGENIADLGGVKIAFRAYRDLRKDATHAFIADGFSEDQMFFVAVAQAWCTKDRKEEVQRRLAVDPHSPPKFRVYGALRNLPEFAQAFSCASGTPMHPAQTCSVW